MDILLARDALALTNAKTWTASAHWGTVDYPFEMPLDAKALGATPGEALRSLAAIVDEKLGYSAYREVGDTQ
jgi:hypothetical protein